MRIQAVPDLHLNAPALGLRPGTEGLRVISYKAVLLQAWTSRAGDTPGTTLRFRDPPTFRVEREIEVDHCSRMTRASRRTAFSRIGSEIPA